jgi:5-methylcytosine-specific restriction endonuclease McrA
MRLEVWKRDEEMCVMCSSQEWIEYDHIIPFSKGGSNTALNIQLLCKFCNRAKNAEI